MRTVELAKVAVSAESLVLRREARRQAMRAGFGAGAAIFGIAALAALHVVLYQLLGLYMRPLFAALIVLGVDVVAAAALGYFTLATIPDPVQEEARAIRTQAMDEMRRSLTIIGMTAEVAALLLRTSAQNRMRNGLANTLAMAASRLLGR